MSILNAFPDNLAAWLVIVPLFAVYLGIALWCLKVDFFGADRTFIKLHKTLKKQGMFALFTFIQVFMMSLFIIFGIVIMFGLLAHRFGL